MTIARFLRRVAPGAWLVVALAACTPQQGIDYGLAGRFVETTAASLGLGEEEVPERPERTRAELDRIPAATIAVSFDDFPRSYLTPQSDAGGYLNYRDPARRGVRIFGGAIAGTFGFGEDLLAVRHQREDPIARPTPLEEWPFTVDREYQYRQRDLFDYSITVTCVFERAVRENIVIVERTYEVVRMIETCRNARRTFVNTYWVEPETGFIWKSRQWTGPEIRPVIVEIIKPYVPTT